MENYSWKLEIQTLQFIVMNENNFNIAKKYLKKEYFFDYYSKNIYDKILTLENPNLSSLYKILNKTEIDRFNANLPRLASDVTSLILNLEELYKRRKIQEINKYCEIKISEGELAKSVIDYARQELIKLVEDNDFTNENVSVAFLRYIEAIKNGEIKFYLTGFQSLDELLYGFASDDLIIIGARPSVGKTSLALNFMNFQSQITKLHIKFYSLEVVRNSIIINLIGINKGIPAYKYFKNELSEYEMKEVETFISNFSNEKLEIIDNLLNIDDICNDIELSKADIFYIDYVQIIGSHHSDIFNRVTHVMRKLKNLQIKIQKPIVLISQAKRPISKKDKSTKEDLKGSGSIEEEATKIIMINSYFSEYSQMEMYNLSIEKNKQGATGDVPINFDKARFKFYE